MGVLTALSGAGYEATTWPPLDGISNKAQVFVRLVFTCVDGQVEHLKKSTER